MPETRQPTVEAGCVAAANACDCRSVQTANVDAERGDIESLCQRFKCNELFYKLNDRVVTLQMYRVVKMSFLNLKFKMF